MPHRVNQSSNFSTIYSPVIVIFGVFFARFLLFSISQLYDKQQFVSLSTNILVSSIEKSLNICRSFGDTLDVYISGFLSNFPSNSFFRILSCFSPSHHEGFPSELIPIQNQYFIIIPMFQIRRNHRSFG